MNTLFTVAQGDHASKVVLQLMQKHRFFLNIGTPPNRFGTGGSDAHNLDPDIFDEAIRLDAALRSAYVTQESQSFNALLMAEAKLGITSHTPRSGQHIAKCTIYSGGFDIGNVWPLTKFLKFLPESYERLFEEGMNLRMGTKSVDDFSKNRMNELRELADKKASKLLENIESLLEFNTDKKRCVVLMKTRFYPEFEGAVDNDLFRQKTEGMQGYSDALGYLFTKSSGLERVVDNNFVLFSSDRDSHTVMSHMASDAPLLSTKVSRGYSCKVYFAAVL